MNRGLGHEQLRTWFGLSYASFLTMPRVLMEQMPDEWQGKMAALLDEYDEAYPIQPEGMGTTVRVTMNGKLTKAPSWLINYRHPDFRVIDQLRGKS